jgi:hypothetical protein
MRKTVFFFLTLALGLTSCTTLRTNTAKRMDIYGSGVIQHPVVAELFVRQSKITGTANNATTVEEAKNNAVVDALRNSSADVLIEPTFEVVRSRGVISATVTGFPATYTNFRPATYEDIPLLDMGVLQYANVYEPTQVEKKNSRFGMVLGIVSATIGAFALAVILLGM